MVEVGSKAPNVELVDTDKKAVKISDFAGKPTVILFYPGAFTGVCTKEMCSFRDGLPKYAQQGVSMIAISVDSPFANKGFKDANAINFPLLSDYSREAVKAYDLALENFAGLKGYTASKRAVFVLDKNQIVRFKWIGENPGIEPDYSVVAREAEKVKSM
ncbi:MAG: redoxin domain-containing protein [Nitrososphaerota archaeon]|nr:redoxin domain-containing protein [Nitrososphaerota archaeon]MDG6923068.1 redoxin domain-containing protein [Nitrososphaerota archaeon]